MPQVLQIPTCAQCQKNPPLLGETVCYDCMNKARNVMGMAPLVVLSPSAMPSQKKSLSPILRKSFFATLLILAFLASFLFGAAVMAQPSKAASQDASPSNAGQLYDTASQLYSFDNFNSAYLLDPSGCQTALGQDGKFVCIMSGAPASSKQVAGSQEFTDWRICGLKGECIDWQNDLATHPKWRSR